MAEFDPQTVTLGELAEIYTREQGLKKPLSLGAMSKFKDVPALEFFSEDGEEPSQAKQVIKSSQQVDTKDTVKNTLKAMRYLSNRLYNAYPRNPPDFLVPNEKNVPLAAQEFFGMKEPPKAVSSLQLSSEPEFREKFIDELMEYAANNPDKRPHVRAILFGLNTGLRPNANIGVNTSQYIINKGALYIRPEVTGAKGRAVSIPLNDIADSMLQQQIREFKSEIDATRKPLLDKEGNTIIDPETGKPVMGPGKIWVDTNGKPLKTSDINEVLEQIKVPELVYDEKTGKYYDSLKPVDGESSKFGMSLFRNWHTTLGRKYGVNDLVLAKLQGRSTKSYGRGDTGELSTYDSAYPGDVSDFEREEANKFRPLYGQYVEQSKSRIKNQYPNFTFDWGGNTDTITTRITSRTEGYGDDYFSRRVEEQAETPTKKDRIADAEAKLKEKTPGIINKLLGLVGKGGAVGLAGLGIAGVATEAKAAASEEFGRSGSPLRAAGAGVLRGAYELAETPAMMFTRPLPAGGPESSLTTPEQQVAQGKTIEEQMGRIRQFEAKMGPGIGGPVPPQQRGLIDDEMSKLLQGE